MLAHRKTEPRRPRAAASRLTVGISEFKVSRDPRATLATYALGSCIAILLYAPRRTVAGLLHFMLADSKINPEKALARPGMFADTGMRHMLAALAGLGVGPTDLVAKVVGGGNLAGLGSRLTIGEDNQAAARALLAEQNIRIVAEDVGGSRSRSAFMTVKGGAVLVRVPTGDYEI